MLSIQIATFILLLVTQIQAAWETCDDLQFCSDIRYKENPTAHFHLTPASIVQYSSSIQATIIDEETNKEYIFKLNSLAGNIYNLLIEDPNKSRYSAREALKQTPLESAFTSVTWNDTILIATHEESKVILNLSNLKIEVYRKESLMMVLNNYGKMEFQDQAIALDVSIKGAKKAYGIPEHAERLALRTTGPNIADPYRLFNADRCCYAIESGKSLYGSIPVLYGHGSQQSSGLFWLNAAQTFVDINNGNNQVDAFFISERGLIDVFILTGPSLADSVKQYSTLTGSAPLPQLFTMGYHQCRWSYKDRADIETVVTEFDNNNFPMDVIWLDIDYTDGMRYFTWDYEKFPEPKDMQANLDAVGRKLVVIVDPHIKVDENYTIYSEALVNGYFINNNQGVPYVGTSWPGDSSWLDFLNQDAREWYANKFKLENFPDSTLNMYLWNDMNEPSVFGTDEQTIALDAVHSGGWIHSDLHNIYGSLQTMGTFQGLLDRSGKTLRPFILTRSHFAGTQRYAAVWTGDNVASWEHLYISIPMCLTEALAGISFCGADVGGFSLPASDQLFQRWYQVGAWLPFFRGHTSNLGPRREPYLYPEDVQVRLRNAMYERYFHLPYWYTIWYEHEKFGDPVIRPISYHYSNDENTFEIDKQFLLGSGILVAPVLEKNASTLDVYLPGGINELWYNPQTNLMYSGGGYATISVNLDSMPVFYRGGSIIPRKDVPRPSSVYTYNDPLNLWIFLDSNHQATGTFYVDDYKSFNYQNNKEFMYIKFDFANDVLTSTILDEEASYDIPFGLNATIIFKPPAFVEKSLISNGLGRMAIAQIGYSSTKPDISIHNNLNKNLNSELKIKLT